MPYTYDYFQKSVDYLKEKVDFTPEIAIILGSCLGPFAEEIENPIVVDYKDIPNFLVSTVASHAGKLIFGTVCGRKVVCMSGRFHSIDMIKSPLTVVQQCSSGQVTISYLIKHTGLFPFTASGTQARREHHHLTAFFFIGRKPHC